MYVHTGGTLSLKSLRDITVYENHLQIFREPMEAILPAPTVATTNTRIFRRG